MRRAIASLAEKDSFIATNATAAKNAGERGELEAQLESVRKDAEELRKVAREWPVAVDAVRRLAGEAAAAETAAATLETELSAAKAVEAGRGLREKHARVVRRQAQLTEAQARLVAAPRLSRKDLEEIRRAFFAVEKLEAGLAAGALSVTVAARRTVDIIVQEDFSAEDRRSMAPGETVRLGAASRVRIVHPDMELEVRSGDADAEARAEAVSTARRALVDLLARSGAHDLADAEERFRVAESLSVDAQAARKNLDEELAGETLPELESRVRELGPDALGRPIATISADWATARSRAGTCRRDLAREREKIDAWTVKYKSEENLEDTRLSVAARVKELEGRLAAFAPLPPGFTDGATFLAAFKKAERDLTSLRVELTELEGKKSGLEQRAGDQSAEELAVRMKDADEAFAAVRRRAAALDRIVMAAEGLVGTDGAALYDGIRAGLEKRLSAIRGKDAHVEMDGPLPAGLAGEGERAVGWDLLSAGTRDVLALALRLSMADYFIGDADGFLMMDDPLVDMDPDRQAAVASALRSFAATKQLIVFTCHPSTAELLAGPSPAGEILTM
jgi:exonuclease SbcC